MSRATDVRVKKVEHTLGSSGYVTQFDVRRVYDPGVR